MVRVFVSHSSRDDVLAGELHRWLVAEGHDVFLDNDLRGGIAVGDDWQQRLHERLRWADAVVCLLTSAYRESVWCSAEVGIALSRGCRVLPLLAEEGAVHPLLTGLQYADLAGDRGAAWVALDAELRRLDAAGGRGWPDDRSPFPGLRAFDVDQHRAFFGRTADVDRLVMLLRSPAERAETAVLLVVGPSGCGKSSLIRAGLLPAMAAEPDWWVVPAFLPGPHPVMALTREVVATANELGLAWSVSGVRDRLNEGGTVLADIADELLDAVPGKRPRHLLIAVDQVEELLTQTVTDERRRFTQLLRAALDGPVHIVGTLRPEFLDELLADPDSAVLAGRIQPLPLLTRAALRTVIEGPALLAGIRVDDHLVDRMVDDTGSGEALPLLAYTLAQIAEGVQRGDRLLTSRYELLGGVQGALARQGDSALDEAVSIRGRTREQIVRELLRLVTVDEQNRPTRRRVPLDTLPTAVRAELNVFVTRRLLVTDHDRHDGKDVVGVAHEAFLSAWPPLARAITAASTALRAAHRAEQAADDWLGHGRVASRMWGGDQLAAAVADLGVRVRRVPSPRLRSRRRPPSPGKECGRPPPGRRPLLGLGKERVLAAETVELSPEACEFLLESIRRDRSRRRRSTTVLGTLLVLALIGGSLAAVGLRSAERQRQIAAQGRLLATARQLNAQAEAALSTDPRTALELSEAAYRVLPGDEMRANLSQKLGATRYAGTLEPHRAAFAVAFSPDGRTIAGAVADPAVRLWDMTDPSRPRSLAHPLTGLNNVIKAVVFAPDGRTVATGSADSTVQLWAVEDPAAPRRLGDPLTGHTGSVNAVVFSPDGKILATAGNDGAVILWDMGERSRPRHLADPLIAHTGPVNGMAFSPNGQILATAGADATVTLWNLSDRTRPRRLEVALTGYTKPVNAVAFSPDGRTLATGGADATVLLWDLIDYSQAPRFRKQLAGHAGPVNGLAFSPDGRTVATASADSTAALWDVSDHALPRRVEQVLTGHAGPVNGVAFSPDGRQIATAGADKTIILWDVGDRAQPQRLGEPLVSHGGPLNDVAFSPSGHTLATANADTTVVLWDVTDRTRPHRVGDPLTGHSAPVNGVAFSPDGRTLATAGADNTVLLWDVADPLQPRRSGGPLTGHSAPVNGVAFSPDGRTLATAGADNTVMLWDVADPLQPRRSGGPLTGHSAPVNGVAFSPDGRTLATAGADNTVMLWDLTDPTQPRLVRAPLTEHTAPVNGVAFAPDKPVLGTAGADAVAIVWDAADPSQPRRIGDPLIGQSATNAVAFDPHGTTAATANADVTTTLWDLTDTARPHRLGNPLTGHADPVSSVAFTSDGRTLASASIDGSVILWNLDAVNALRNDPMKHACAITRHGLDPAQWTLYVGDLPYQEPCKA